MSRVMTESGRRFAVEGMFFNVLPQTVVLRRLYNYSEIPVLDRAMPFWLPYFGLMAEYFVERGAMGLG